MDTPISIVVAVYNEEECIEEFHRHVTDFGRDSGLDYELILVDDGSRDETPRLLARLAGTDPRVRVVQLQRNFGQTAALAAGIDHARRPVIVTMDADLQNDARDIPALLAKMAEGYDVVSGWRRNRQDSLLSRKLPSRLANALIGKTTGVRLHDYGCTLKAYRTDVLRQVKLYGEQHRFIPALCAIVGARIAEIPVDHHPRLTGVSKYGIGRTLRVVLDLITVKFLLTHATRPMHFFGGVGFLALLAGGLAGAATILMKLGPQGTDMSGNPLLYLCVLLTVVGFQFIAIGLLAELVMRTWYESQAKPVYTVRRVIEGGTPAAVSADI